MSKIVMAHSLMSKTFKGQPFLIDGLICRGEISSIVGSSETGKSMLLRDMALAISGGEESFLGFKTNIQSGFTIYVSTEDGERRTYDAMLKQSEGRNTDSINANLGYIFETEDVMKELSEVQEKRKIDLLIVDCFTDLYRGDLNRANEIRGFFNPYKAFAKRKPPTNTLQFI
jgi:RecA-family ATPase